jgi:hypothetical protein
VQAVRDTYDTAFSALKRSMRPIERAEALVIVERHRLIHATRGVMPTAAGLDAVMTTLDSVLEFQPALVVVDGWEPSEDDLRAFRAVAERRAFATWCVYTPQRSVAVVPGVVEIELGTDQRQVVLHVRRGRDGAPGATMRLDPSAFVARDTPGVAGLSHVPADCTMYSGGAHGAEAAFGEAAERWGVREVNFTFDGPVQARTRGAHPLTEQALVSGEVSLAYVSRRLRRTYGESPQIRRVLQSLWHQVSNAQLVFVIGSIQEDGTVTGGTGWSVELARMWNKRLWVFDQDKGHWYRWDGEEWVTGIPIIDAPAYCGTGTRYLTEVGRTAIDELHARSFGGLGEEA